MARLPDRTRDDNTDVLFPILSQELAGRRVAQFDALVAQGTHPPMSLDEKRAKGARHLYSYSIGTLPGFPVGI